MINYLFIFDQIRFIGGLIASLIMFTSGSFPHKKHFIVRVFFIFIAYMLFSISIFYIQSIENINLAILIIFIGLLYLFMTSLGIIFLLSCYLIGLANAIVRTVFASVFQHVVTIILKQWFVGILYPNFAETNPILYTIIIIIFYVLLYYLLYKFFLSKNENKEDLMVPESRSILFMYLLILLLYTVVFDMVSFIMEYIFPKIEVIDKYSSMFLLNKYALILFQILFVVILFVIHLSANKNKKLQQEKAVALHITSERRRQYNMSVYNIENLRQKSHNLKYFIKSLEHATEIERNKMISSIKKTTDLHEGIITSSNEVLNIILTEKNMLCLSNNIKLTCNLNYVYIQFIDTIDMYTFLGNAIDNAFECVNSLVDDELKIISFSLEKKGNMIVFEIENYFENSINIVNGLPITSKKDSSNHGIGLNSIKAIIKKYDGVLHVKTEEHIFILKIIIPIP